MSVEEMRVALMDVYPGWGWKNKVESMSDNQVMAVYYKFLNKGKFDYVTKKSNRSSTKKETNNIREKPKTFKQLSFDDVI